MKTSTIVYIIISAIISIVIGVIGSPAEETGKIIAVENLWCAEESAAAAIATMDDGDTIVVLSNGEHDDISDPDEIAKYIVNRSKFVGEREKKIAAINAAIKKAHNVKIVHHSDGWVLNGTTIIKKGNFFGAGFSCATL